MKRNFGKTTLTIMRGLPGSGKSTLARGLSRKTGAVIVSYDSMRTMLGGSRQGWQLLKKRSGDVREHGEGILTHSARAMSSSLLRNGVSVIFDAQNITIPDLKDLVDLAAAAHADVRMEDLTDVPLEDLIARNRTRPEDDRVPDSYIREQHLRLNETVPFTIDDLKDDSNLLIKMAANRNVRVKRVKGEDDVYACNFTRKAFFNHEWDEYSSKARGLFLDHTGGVVMRGFDKFFNIGENDETTLERVLDRVTYPATVELKQNGFLGLIGARSDGTLRFYSKSGQTDYSALVEEAFRNQLGNDPSLIRRVHDVLTEHNVTITCEVIDHDSDRHIVSYDHSECFFIHCVRNDLAFSIDHDADDEIMNGIGWKNEDIRRITVINDRGGLADAISRAHDSDREGIVIYSHDGYMAKVKSDRYLRVKRLRHVLEDRFIHGKGGALPRNPEDEAALDYVLDHADMSKLIYERKAFHEEAVDMTWVGGLLDEMDDPSVA